MNIKLYTQNNCHYCKNVKEKLDEFHINYDEIDISLEENKEEWNKMVRISGLPMTPTIFVDNEIWAPNRDFRSPEELATRLQEIEKMGGLIPVSKEEQFDVLMNNMKNLAVGMRNLQTQLHQMSAKLNPPPQPTVASTPGTTAINPPMENKNIPL